MKKLPNRFYDRFGILKQRYIVALSLIKHPVIYYRFFYPQGNNEVLYSYKHEVYDLLVCLGFKIEWSWKINVPLDKSDTIIISNRAFQSINSNLRFIMFKDA